MKRLISLFLVCALSTLIPCPSGADFKNTKGVQLQGERYACADMGQIVAERLLTAPVKEARFHVIEQRLLERVIDEQELGVTGMVNERSAARLGKLLGAKVIMEKIAKAEISEERTPAVIDYGHMLRNVVEPSPSSKGQPTVTTQPVDTRIPILNIRPCYHAGMEPEAGKYHLEVSAPGYETDKKWIEVGAEEDRRVAQPAPPTGKTFTNSLGMRFVLIPAGSFTMGSPASEPKRFDDERQHRVSISRAFYMQITEVTQGQWREVMGDNPSHFKNCGDDCPVEKISWYDVQSFIRRLNEREGTKKYRLPTEAEWEYACRAGTSTPFFFGGCLSTDEANFDANYPMPGCPKGRYLGKPIPVDSFPPNAWGLYGMHGNVWEWCQDWYGPYPLDNVTDPTGSPSGKKRVLRGGSWRCDARCSRSANRGWGFPGCRNNYFGFRVARTF